MPRIVWEHTLKLKDVWRAEGVTLAQLTEITSDRMRRLAPRLEDEDARYEWEDLAEQIEAAESYEEVDEVMSTVYDLADDQRIWIETF